MNIQALIDSLNNTGLKTPLETWDPPYCGPLDLIIKANGEWLYQGTPITRQKIINLFASVLCVEENEYFLKTPVEKVRIEVERYPFLHTQWCDKSIDGASIIVLTTNVGDEIALLNGDTFEIEGDYIATQIRRGLKAGLHRNVYYQLCDRAKEDEKGMYVESNNRRHYLYRF